MSPAWGLMAPAWPAALPGLSRLYCSSKGLDSVACLVSEEACRIAKRLLRVCGREKGD